MIKVNVGVLGYGFVQSTFHLPCYKEIMEANVAAIGGRQRGIAEETAKKFGIKKVYSGEDFVEKLCSNPEIDVVGCWIAELSSSKSL